MSAYAGSPLADVPVELINRVLDFHECCTCGRVMGFSSYDGQKVVTCDNCDYWRPLAATPERWDR